MHEQHSDIKTNLERPSAASGADTGAVTKIATHFNFDRLIIEAELNRRPVPLERVQQELGDLLGDLDLSNETLVLRGDMPVALTSTTWLRLVRAARARQQRS